VVAPREDRLRFRGERGRCPCPDRRQRGGADAARRGGAGGAGGGPAPDGGGDAALRAHLDEKSIVELLVVISFYNGVVRVLASLQIDVEPEYQPYLDAFPLPA